MFSSAAELPVTAAAPFAALPAAWPAAGTCAAGHDWGPEGTAETCQRPGCGVHILDVGISWTRRHAQQCPHC